MRIVYGWIGEAQAAWFAKWLRPFEDSEWLRIGIVRHDSDPGGGWVGADPALLRDVGTLDRLLGRRLNLLLHGPGPGGRATDCSPPAWWWCPRPVPARKRSSR